MGGLVGGWVARPDSGSRHSTWGGEGWVGACVRACVRVPSEGGWHVKCVNAHLRLAVARQPLPRQVAHALEEAACSLGGADLGAQGGLQRVCVCACECV